jgi:hypothetical protein
MYRTHFPLYSPIDFNVDGPYFFSVIFKDIHGFERKLSRMFSVFVLNSVTSFTEAELHGLQLTRLFE